MNAIAQNWIDADHQENALTLVDFDQALTDADTAEEWKYYTVEILAEPTVEEIYACRSCTIAAWTESNYPYCDDCADEIDAYITLQYQYALWQQGALERRVAQSLAQQHCDNCAGDVQPATVTTGTLYGEYVVCCSSACYDALQALWKPVDTIPTWTIGFRYNDGDLGIVTTGIKTRAKARTLASYMMACPSLFTIEIFQEASHPAPVVVVAPVVPLWDRVQNAVNLTLASVGSFVAGYGIAALVHHIVC